MQVVPQHDWRVVIVVTSTVVNEIAKTIKDLPTDFDPASWLQQNHANLSIVAPQAVRDVVWEVLKIGLSDHPLVLEKS
jgi:hypothetical protein